MLLDFSKYSHPEQHFSPQNIFEEKTLQLLDYWHTNETIEITTSGSTGMSKIITHHKKHMLQSAKMTGVFFQFQEGQTALLCLPTDKIAGIMMLVRALHWKMKLYCLPPKLHLDLESLPPLDFAAMIPAQAAENLQKIQRIKTLLLGGAPVSFPLEQNLQKLPTNCFVSYGMTETISHIAARNLSKGEQNYRTLPNIFVSTDKRNCLVITAEKLGIKNLYTNDIVELSKEKSFKIIGRYDNVINSGGLKIVAEAIEKQIQPLLTQNFYIKGIADEQWGETVALFIESEAFGEQELSMLQERLKSIVPKQAIPKKIIFLPKFNYTTNGKLLR